MMNVRTLGSARLELFEQLRSQIAFSDFCTPSGTIEFIAHNGLLNHSFTLFKLTYPGYEFTSIVRDGAVFIYRNGFYQHSDQYTGTEDYHVVIQWDVGYIGCRVLPNANSDAKANQSIRSTHTPITVPPIDLVRALRSENLLVNSAYKNPDDCFSSVLDCLHLSELDIRRHGGEKFIWSKTEDSMKPFDEPDISRYVALFLSSHGAARNFDVTCESIAGTGNVDFYVVAPQLNGGLIKIAIEAKKAENTNLAHGLKVQLPQYMARIGTHYGIYLTYWLKSARYQHPSYERYVDLEFKVLNPIPRLPTVRTLSLDLSLGPSPSQRT